MTGVVCYGENQEERTLSFLEILLDESVLTREIYVRGDAITNVGGWNEKLDGNRNLELVLRVAKQYEVVASKERPKGDWILLKEQEENQEQKWRGDCYLTGRYKEDLIAAGCLENAIQGLLWVEEQQEDFSGTRQEHHAFLEDMLSGGTQYYKRYDATQPILVYCGDEECNAILDVFARNFGKALEQKGKKVLYFDLSRHDFTEINQYLGKRFQAIVGFQTYLFSAKLQSGENAHDKMIGPKFNFLFDHPIWFQNQLICVPKDYCILTVDRNYASFLEKYNQIHAAFLPPAGVERYEHGEQPQYDIVFLGSHKSGVSLKLSEFLKLDKETRILWNHYLTNMKQNLEKTPEEVFFGTLDELGYTLPIEEAMSQFHKARVLITTIAGHYRRKVIEELLKGGLQVHIFGSGWEDTGLQKYDNLILHDSIPGEESLAVFANAKIALNIMTWHKDAYTERIANAMLQKAVVLTDETRYLRENFTDGKDILLFRLDETRQLPHRVKELLSQPEKISQIAEMGYEKTKKEHTWEKRAEQFLQILKES